MNAIEKIEQLARKAHEYQFRRDGVTPYIKHVETVVENVIKRHGSAFEICAAWAHDVFEDTTFNEVDIRRALCEDLSIRSQDEIVDAIYTLTHIEGESYEQSILRAKKNPIARQVKIADNLANLSDNPTDKQILKYAKSLQILMSDD